ncbi:MAG TPA: SRPBCC domain-containing protein [Candidatus Acidoferrales bacterium]|nr:SRPBCC domain-containing protein [Candidatus Acidoferrales bacterium]
MKWAGIIVGGLAALVALMVAVGALLPKNHLATQAATFRSQQARVWQAITDVAKFPAWRKDVKEVIAPQGADARAGWTEVWPHGERVPIEVREWTPPTRLVTRIAAPDLAFGGTWTYELQPTAAGTELRITEHGEVYNPLFRALSKFVFGHTAAMRDYLVALGKSLGEDIQVRD